MFARICYRWPDGTEIDIECGADSAEFPDAFDEIVAEALRIYTTIVAEG